MLEEEVWDSTTKLYPLHWDKISAFYGDRDLEPTAASLLKVMDFLAMLAKKSKSKLPGLIKGSIKCMRIDACVSESANSFADLYHLNLHLFTLGVYVKTIYEN